MQNPNLDSITVVEPNSSLWPLTPKDFWKWREAFYRLICKEFQVRFRGTYLGYLWIILQPMMFLGVFSIVLSGNKNLGPADVPYSVYMLSGLVFWTFISNGFVQGSTSLLDSRALIIQTNLKRALIPLSILCSKLLDLFFGVLFLMIWIAFDARVSISPQVCLLLVDILGIVLVLTGMTFAFSALCIEFKDIRYIVPFLAQVLFFATPIFYAMPDSPKAWLLYLNPFTVFMLSVRDHVLGTNFVGSSEYASGFAIAVMIFFVGGMIFKKFEKNFADVI